MHSARELPRRRWHRRTFALAGAYNVGWGVLAAVAPGWPFRLAGLAPMRYPAIFTTLGMVIGLYGLLYWWVATRPEDGWPIAAVGLAGKVLGPLGMAVLVGTGAWPLEVGLLIVVTNDLVWWGPFGLYLRDAWPGFRAELSGVRRQS